MSRSSIEFDAIRQAQSPFDLLRRQAELWPDQPLLILPKAVQTLWGLDRSVWTYAEALVEVSRLASAYREAGYGPGHRVALMFENRPQHFLHWLALNSVGTSVVPLNPDYKDEELIYALDHSAACLIASVPACLPSLKAAARAKGLEVWLDGPVPAAPLSPGATVGREEDRECVLAYTSGTTGRPKGCILSNRYFLCWGEWYVAQEGKIRLREGQERLITPLPTFHINAMGNSFVGMLASGGAQIIVDRFHPRSWLDMARETGASCFHYLGVMPAILLALPESSEDRSHNLRFGLGGGVHPDHHSQFETRFGVPLLEGWAMTEAGGAALLCAAEEPRQIGTRCIGPPDRPGPGLDWRIVDDAGRDVVRGQSGEFLVRAKGADPRRGLFSGYLNDPAATDLIWADGWLRTGDVMIEDSDGQLHFAERKKDLIRRSGENISGAEVEAVLLAHPDVRQVAVVPCPDPLREEEVVAVVVAKSADAEPARLAQSLFDHSARHLAYYKLPGHIIFINDLPVTSTGKLAKGEIRALASKTDTAYLRFDLREQKQAQRLAGRDGHEGLQR